MENEDFHNFDGTISRVKMLRSSESTYFENGDYIGFAKPYKGGRFSYVALLPKEENGFTKESLRALNFSECLAGTENVIARVLMPEFHCSTDYNLTGFLKQRGIRTVFTPLADFSPLSSAWLKAEAVMHKAYIEVDRQGTKAAAVTSMMGFAGAAPFEFPEIREVRIDRPFLYFIVHQKTGVPVFAGRIQHLDPLSDNEDRLTDQEKERLCRPFFDDICNIILDEDGIVKDDFDRHLYSKTYEAYLRRDLETLQSIYTEVSLDSFFNGITED